MTRRSLLSQSALASAAVLSGCKRPAASERIALGCIGVGKMGTRVMENFLGDSRVQVTAVCDVNKESDGYWHNEIYGRDPAVAMVDAFYGKAWNRPDGGAVGCVGYNDYREMLSNEDLDAVLISTPDHWHSLQALDAIQAGLAVYGQKPLALTIGQGREIADAVAAKGTVWQTGSQQRSDQYFRRGCEIVRAGVIGKVKRVRMGLPGGNSNYSRRGKERDVVPVPEGFDFDRWLGPAPVAEYSPARTHANWRWNFDYAGGNIADWGAHHIDIAMWGLGLEHTGPVEVRIIDAVMPEVGDFYNTAEAFHFEAEFANGTVLSVADDKTHEEFSGGVRFEGEDGQWVWCDRGELKTNPGSLRGWKPEDGAWQLRESKQHEQEFISAILEKRPTVAPAEAAHRAITVSHIANIALRLGRKSLKWDPVAERFPDDEEANGYLVREVREGWGMG